MKAITVCRTIGVVLCLAQTARAELPYRLSVGAGRSPDRGSTYRIGLQRHFDTSLLGLRLRGYNELTANFWKGGSDSITAISFSPVLAFPVLRLGETVRVFAEAGIGAGYLSDDKFLNRDLATRFQFEDRIGLALRRGGRELNLRYMHYSNGSIKQPNDGMDFFVLSLMTDF